MLQYTLRAIGYTHVLLIPDAVMEQIVLPTLPRADLPAPIEQVRRGIARSRQRRRIGRRARKSVAEVMEFLTENRFFNGTRDDDD